MSKDETIAQLEKTLAFMTESMEQQALTIQQLQATIVRLNQTIAQLNEKLHKNSKNSSKPPSSDGLAKPKPSSLRKPSGRKAGAQNGHDGNGLSLMSSPTQTIPHKPAQCGNCPMNGTCISCGRSAVRNVVDVEIKTTVTAHYTEQYACPMQNGVILSGEFPEGVNSSLQYGDGIRALAIALNTSGMMGNNRVHEILMAVLGVPISTGTVCAMVEQFGRAISGTVQEIAMALLDRPVVHCDETGTRVEGTNYWVHSACDSLFTYLSLQPKRGYEGMEAAGFLPAYEGIIVHDCWKPYWSVEGVIHGLCCAHLLRELNSVIDNTPEQAGWAKDMQELLLEMNQCRTDALKSGLGSIESEILEGYGKRYDAILEEAYLKNPLPEKEAGKRGRPKKGKRRALIERLAEHKEEVCLFIRDLRVPFTNNLAEQSVRMMKVKTKVSGCFRTSKGAECFAAIMSYLQTAMKHHINAYTAILEGLAGNSHALIFGVD